MDSRLLEISKALPGFQLKYECLSLEKGFLCLKRLFLVGCHTLDSFHDTGKTEAKSPLDLGQLAYPAQDLRLTCGAGPWGWGRRETAQTDF